MALRIPRSPVGRTSEPPQGEDEEHVHRSSPTPLSGRAPGGDHPVGWRPVDKRPGFGRRFGGDLGRRGLWRSFGVDLRRCGYWLGLGSRLRWLRCRGRWRRTRGVDRRLKHVCGKRGARLRQDDSTGCAPRALRGKRRRRSTQGFVQQRRGRVVSCLPVRLVRSLAAGAAVANSALRPRASVLAAGRNRAKAGGRPESGCDEQAGLACAPNLLHLPPNAGRCGPPSSHARREKSRSGL